MCSQSSHIKTHIFNIYYYLGVLCAGLPTDFFCTLFVRPEYEEENMDRIDMESKKTNLTELNHIY